MFKKKLATIIASILTIVSCCMLFSACMPNTFLDLKNVTFKGENLTLVTQGTHQAIGNLTINDKTYFIVFSLAANYGFFVFDCSDVTELQSDEIKNYRWEVTTRWWKEEGEDEYPTDYEFMIYHSQEQFLPLKKRQVVLPIWIGGFNDNGFPFYKLTNRVEMRIGQDLLSEREGTPSYAGKTIELKRQK